ncbi:MAG: hypothetical protein H6622_14880 [Halobacteriovoraceae bacterium]|nr:hypothetical protein [Halobacteriovoraceae bacterium]
MTKVKNEKVSLHNLIVSSEEIIIAEVIKKNEIEFFEQKFSKKESKDTRGWFDEIIKVEKINVKVIELLKGESQNLKLGDTISLITYHDNDLLNNARNAHEYGSYKSYYIPVYKEDGDLKKFINNNSQFILYLQRNNNIYYPSAQNAFDSIDFKNEVKSFLKESSQNLLK